MKMTLKTLMRTIRATFGRYVAIFAIVALGIGFFTGLKSAKPSMQKTADEYLNELNMYDFQLMSTLGFTQEDIDAFADTQGISAAEGSVYADVLADFDGAGDLAYRIYSLPEEVALPKLMSGRLPLAANECIVDAEIFTEDDIGKTLVLSGNNESDTLEQFNQTEFTIVGTAQSPRYISIDRDSTSLGSGKVEGFVYILPDAFETDVYMEALLSCESDELLFSDEYYEMIDSVEPSVKSVLQERADMRYDEIISDANAELSDARAELDSGWERYNTALESGIPEQMLADALSQLESGEEDYSAAQAEVDAIKPPTTYLLDLDSNSGCSTYKNDIVVVDGIAYVFPAFFVIIAALVCITTMTRMVNDERTQIGTLKALGYSYITISLKYILYASSAALLGCVAGFFLGTGVLPQIIWSVYDISYGFSDLVYHFSFVMYACCLAISLAGSVAVTLYACRRELSENPAELVRPKSPPNGKRILLEYIKPIWSRMSFLSKVTIRNAFRYKKRMVMMLLGIGGCTALMVTGLGIRDSVAHILDYQYDEIMLYDASATYDSDSADSVEEFLDDRSGGYITGYQDTMTVSSGSGEKDANVIALNAQESEGYFDLHDSKEEIPYPTGYEAVVSSKLASQLGVSAGDRIFLNFDGDSVGYTVTGVCDNFVNHYVYISEESVSDYAPNAAYIMQGEQEDIQAIAAGLRAIDGVSYVSVIEQERALMENSMSSMDYIVVVVVLFAGALAFVVLYNLTNINIIERMREVATVKVLGFRPGETASYVLRENIIFSVIGGLIGLGVGWLLHGYVMAQVHVDAMTFDVRISALSYVIAFACTIGFTVIANIIMRFKLDKVNMAESLKSVE